MGVKPTALTFKGLLFHMHVVCGLLHANIAALLFEFILTTAITKSKVLTQWVIAIGQINPCFHIFIIIIPVGITCFTLEAVLTLPLFRDVCNLRLKTEGVVWSITPATEVELILISSLSTELTRFAIKTFPVRLVHLLNLITCQLQAVSMKALRAK